MGVLYPDYCRVNPQGLSYRVIICLFSETRVCVLQGYFIVCMCEYKQYIVDS